MGFLDITFTEKDELELNKCVEEFDKLCETQYPKVLEYNHYDLSKRTNISSPNVWKRFLLNPKVKEWYNTERLIFVNSEVQRLMSQAGDSHSTASVQALNALLAQQKALGEQSDQKTLIVYNFIPITDEERKSGVINEVRDVPSGIRRAVTYLKSNSSK